jgi:hypothetical protein
MGRWLYEWNISNFSKFFKGGKERASEKGMGPHLLIHQAKTSSCDG